MAANEGWPLLFRFGVRLIIGPACSLLLGVILLAFHDGGLIVSHDITRMIVGNTPFDVSVNARLDLPTLVNAAENLGFSSGPE
jgi:hypothetical protein